MNSRVPKIAQLLRKWCAEQSGRTCESMFAEFMSSVLTKTEAKRFFNAYADEPCLNFYSKGGRMCTIAVHQDHFNDDAVAEIAETIDLAETIDPRHGKAKGTKQQEVPVASKECNQELKMGDLQYNEKTGDFEPGRRLRSLDELSEEIYKICEELDAYGAYLIADKDGYAIRKDFHPII